MTGHPCGHGRFEGGQGLEQPGWANEAFANEAFANLLKDRLEPSPVYLPVTTTFLPAPVELEGYRKRERWSCHKGLKLQCAEKHNTVDPQAIKVGGVDRLLRGAEKPPWWSGGPLASRF